MTYKNKMKNIVKGPSAQNKKIVPFLLQKRTHARTSFIYKFINYNIYILLIRVVYKFLLALTIAPQNTYNINIYTEKLGL